VRYLEDKIRNQTTDIMPLKEAIKNPQLIWIIIVYGIKNESYPKRVQQVRQERLYH
jgi:hypothetical protein